MKYLFAALLIGMIVLSFVAYSMIPRPPDDGKVDLTWVSDPNPARQEQIAAFNRMFPECRLRLDSNNADMTKILVQSSVRIGPDIIDVYGIQQMYVYVEAGILLDVTDIAKEMGFDPSVTYPKARDTFTIEGRQYGFPCNVDAPVIFYNKNLFDQYSVPYPEGHWTWEECIETALKLTHKRPGGRGYERFGLALGYSAWQEILMQFGASVFSEDGTRCTLDTPEALEAMQFYYDLHFKWHVVPTPSDKLAMSGEGGWGAGEIRWFGNGRIAMMRIGRWGLIQFRKYDNLRLGVCHMPHPEGRELVVLAASRSAAVNAKGPHPEHAVKFLKYLTSKAYNDLINMDADALPPNKAYATPEHMHNPKHPEDDEYNAYFVEALQYGKGREVNPFINPYRAMEIIQREVDLMLAQEKSPRQAMLEATQRINKEMEKNISKSKKLQARYEAALRGGTL